MKKLLLVTIVILLLPGCSDSRKTDQDSKALDGVWAMNGEENALFEIDGDTITLAHEGRLHFWVSGDTLVIDYGEGILGRWPILKHTKDSLIFQKDLYVTRLYKR